MRQPRVLQGAAGAPATRGASPSSRHTSRSSPVSVTNTSPKTAAQGAIAGEGRLPSRCALWLFAPGLACRNTARAVRQLTRRHTVAGRLPLPAARLATCLGLDAGAVTQRRHVVAHRLVQVVNGVHVDPCIKAIRRESEGEGDVARTDAGQEGSEDIDAVCVRGLVTRKQPSLRCATFSTCWLRCLIRESLSQQRASPPKCVPSTSSAFALACSNTAVGL